jgi:hypothetical protein
MRKRLIRLALMFVVVPAAVRGAEVVADRLEAQSGPSRSSRALRQASAAGRRLAQR